MEPLLTLAPQCHESIMLRQTSESHGSPGWTRRGIRDLNDRRESGNTLAFPLWILVNPNHGLGQLMRLQGMRGEIGTPLFSSQDLAKRFQETAPQLGHYLVEVIDDQAAFSSFLGELERQRISHVTIDPIGLGVQFVCVADLHARIDSRR